MLRHEKVTQKFNAPPSGRRRRSHLPDSHTEAFPAGHAVLHLVVLGPLPRQALALLDLGGGKKAARGPAVTTGSATPRPHGDATEGRLRRRHKCLTTDLERLVLPAELLHGGRRVVQLPPQLHHLGLQFLHFAFTFHAPEAPPQSNGGDLWERVFFFFLWGLRKTN